MDVVKTSLIVGGVALVIFAVSLGVVVWNNIQSRNVALAAGGVAAAIVLLSTQVWYELRQETRREYIGVEYVVDRRDLSVSQWRPKDTETANRYPSSAARQLVESRASEALASNAPSELRSGNIASDMLYFSLLSYLAQSQLDWQLEVWPLGLRARSIQLAFPSAPAQCTPLPREKLESLRTPRFAAVPLLRGPFDDRRCLPPKTSVGFDSRGVLVLENPFCRIEVSSTPGSSIAGHPEQGNRETLGSGEPRYLTEALGIQVLVTYAATRAHHGNMPKYQAWSDQFIGGLREWFEGSRTSN